MQRWCISAEQYLGIQSPFIEDECERELKKTKMKIDVLVEWKALKDVDSNFYFYLK